MDFGGKSEVWGGIYGITDLLIYGFMLISIWVFNLNVQLPLNPRLNNYFAIVSTAHSIRVALSGIFLTSLNLA